MKQMRPKLAINDSSIPDQVQALYRFLKARGAFNITQLRNGLFPAVGRECKTAKSSGYKNIWVRDNIHIAYAYWQIGRTAKALKCVTALASFFRKHDYRFKNIISEKADPEDPMQRLHIRFNPHGLKELAQPWSHAQNDAIGYFLWFYAKLTREGIIPKKQADIPLLALIAKYLDAIRFWRDKDSGHWEEQRKVSASSIGIAMAGLLEFEKLIGELNLKAKFQKDTRYHLSTGSLHRLIHRSRRALNRILPSECIQKDPKLNRKYDAALLFLIEPVELLSDKMADRILARVKKNLEGDRGIRRYLMDSYWCPDFRKYIRNPDIINDNEKRNTLARPGQEAQWCIFDPVISTIYGKRYLRSSRKSDLKKQICYFNRALSQITPPRSKHPYRCPEAYFIEKGKFIPNDQIPLTWTQANLLVAFQYIRASLLKYT